jgi:hypothetical protein
MDVRIAKLTVRYPQNFVLCVGNAVSYAIQNRGLLIVETITKWWPVTSPVLYGRNENLLMNAKTKMDQDIAAATAVQPHPTDNVDQAFLIPVQHQRLIDNLHCSKRIYYTLVWLHEKTIVLESSKLQCLHTLGYLPNIVNLIIANYAFDSFSYNAV